MNPALLFFPLLVPQATPVDLTLIPSGIVAKVGIFYPKQAALSLQTKLKKLPPGLEAPKYGEIVLGRRRVALVVDDPEGKPTRIVVDANANGDLSDDGDVKLKTLMHGEFPYWQGVAMVDLGKGQPVAVDITRHNAKDPDTAKAAMSLAYHFDYGYRASFKLDGKPFSAEFAGDLVKGTVLSVDRDGNGQISMRRETMTVGAPFNFTGTTYVMDPSGPRPRLVKAAKKLPQRPLPPNFKIGGKAPSFTVVDRAGKKVNFPGDYKGKIVMLDCWATWCGWCLAEMPNVGAAYAKWKDQGFEVLSICCDQPNLAKPVAKAIQDHKMNWRHVYEGKGMENVVAERYDFNALPFTILVDGDTGRILGTGDYREDGTCDLRGKGLVDFIGQRIAEKKKAAR